MCIPAIWRLTDEETGFYYLQSRYYNPEVGRFISSDVLLSTGQGVIGHNAYAYCLNNPCRLSDSEGSSATLAIGGTAIAFTSVFVLALCVCLIIDLATNQEQSLAQQFVSAIQTIVIDSIATVQAIWDGIVLSNKNQFFGKPGEIKDGPEDYKKTHIGEDGRADMQQHNTNHSNPKLHPNPHWHKVDWSPNGNPILSPNIPGNWPLCGCNVNINKRIWRRNHVFYVWQKFSFVWRINWPPAEGRRNRVVVQAHRIHNIPLVWRECHNCHRCRDTAKLSGDSRSASIDSHLRLDTIPRWSNRRNRGYHYRRRKA